MLLQEAISEFNGWRKIKVKRIDGYDLDLRQFCIFVKNKNIEDINIQEVTEWLSWYKKLGFEPWTVIKKAMALRKFFEYFGRLKYDVIDHWLIPIPAKEYNMAKVCTEHDYRTLLSVVPTRNCPYNHIRNRCIIMLVWDTGIRIGEACSLNLSDVDQETREISVKTEKSRGMRPFRKIPYSDSTAEAMDKWIAVRKRVANGTDALFVGIKTKYGLKCVRLASSAAGEIFRKYSVKAGLGYINPHSLRHHFGTELAKRGLNNSVISEAMGHAQLSSSFRYTQINNQELSDILRKRLN